MSRSRNYNLFSALTQRSANSQHSADSIRLAEGSTSSARSLLRKLGCQWQCKHKNKSDKYFCTKKKRKNINIKLNKIPRHLAHLLCGSRRDTNCHPLWWSAASRRATSWARSVRCGNVLAQFLGGKCVKYLTNTLSAVTNQHATCSILYMVYYIVRQEGGMGP